MHKSKPNSVASRKARDERLHTLRGQRLLTWLAGARPRMFVVFQKSDLLALRR